ncbi:YgdB family protein [Xenorhabdus khoisanae]|uniref:YgdB family protein n=1 Tax=Xenorhabdus khoisanae TaxID=880157 RepID=UPI002358D74A|nr:YgdB family protein [Xenorhabdus khoisanae]MDC9612528.1 YgdB family protein [Xenorhabdus khoisanae]
MANKQQGNILLVSIIMLLALSLMMLKSLHYQQENAMLMMLDEQHYLNAFLRAESSLVWGKVQPWQINQQEIDDWFCLQQTEFNLKSCLKRYSDEFFLLKGIASFTSGENIELYQWMKQMKQLNQDTLISVGLIPVESGWLDFCPVSQVEFCL